jgi:hypothetical protein
MAQALTGQALGPLNANFEPCLFLHFPEFWLQNIGKHGNDGNRVKEAHPHGFLLQSGDVNSEGHGNDFIATLEL